MDGTYQPLSRPIFIYVNKKSISKSEIKEFVGFYLKNAPKTRKGGKSTYHFLIGHINLHRKDLPK